jgi:signal peptidase I
MLPNFVDGQYLVGNRFEAFVGDFEYGDVVVVNVEFKDDGTIDNNGKKIIKRIVGLPGDVIDFKNGKLVRNGVVVIEDYIPSDVYSNENGGEGFPYTVKEGNVFVLGDNRAISKDSRTAYREISNKQIYAVIATWSID